MINFNKKTKIDTDSKKIDRILSKNVEEIFVKESLRKKLESGKQLRIKLGFDPTGSKIHIGRAVVLRKLKEFQDLGHKIVFLVGDFTAKIGDPSDKLDKRPMLDSAKIKENLKDYKKQVAKIIDLKNAEFHFNNKWLSKLNFEQIAELAECFTVQQMSSRRNFKDRLDKGQDISLREFLYPLLQGYDSVVLKSDVEIGGFDQLFNLQAGRIIQKKYGQQEQDIITCVMLEGTDGRKMSTSWGNVINIIDEPNDMFGKIMSVKDELIIKYFKVCTDLEDEEINQIEMEILEGKMNPRDAKVKLGKEIVKMFHSEKDAENAFLNFDKIFSNKEIPDDVEEVEIKKGDEIINIALSKGFVKSKNEWFRLIEQGGVTIMEENTKIKDPKFKAEKNNTYKIGKKNFIKIKIK